MAVSTITYSDKTALNVNADIPDINKVKADDMNEIKSVVNNNASELNNLIDYTVYSTTEKVVGTWIDGKPLYEKTFTNTITINTNYVFGDLWGLDYDYLELYKQSYYKKISGGTYYWMPCFYANANDRARAYTRSSDQKIVVEFYSSDTVTESKGVITIRYTKTTD